MSTGNATAPAPLRRVAGRRRPLLGAVLRISAWLAMLAAVVLLLYLLDLVLPPLDRGVWRAGLRAGIGAGLAGALYQVSRAVSTRGRQLRASTATAVMTRDPRPPILYFRPFGDDKFSYFSLNFTFEEILATVFHDAGPVVAIGRPDESLPPMGAARMWVGNEHWQTAVTSLLERAGVVIIRPGVTPGVLWEVREAIRLVPPERLVIALPTPGRAKNGDPQRQETYARFREVAGGVFPVPLPESIEKAAFLTFRADWTPELSAAVDPQSQMFMPMAQVRTALKPFFARLGLPVRRIFWMASPQLMVLALTVALAQAITNMGPEWKPLELKGGGFVVSLPGVATESEQKMASPVGEVVLHSASASWKNYSYTVGYVDYPAAVMQAQTVEQALDAARDGSVRNTQGKLVRETRITLDGAPGRDLVTEVIGGKGLSKSRLLLIGRRLIEAVAVMPADEEYPLKNSSDVQTFFESLHLRQ